MPGSLFRRPHRNTARTGGSRSASHGHSARDVQLDGDRRSARSRIAPANAWPLGKVATGVRHLVATGKHAQHAGPQRGDTTGHRAVRCGKSHQGLFHLVALDAAKSEARPFGLSGQPPSTGGSAAPRPLEFRRPDDLRLTSNMPTRVANRSHDHDPAGTRQRPGPSASTMARRCTHSAISAAGAARMNPPRHGRSPPRNEASMYPATSPPGSWRGENR